MNNEILGGFTGKQTLAVVVAALTTVAGGLMLSGKAVAQAAQISVSCSKIVDATERLACFDLTFPNPDRAITGGSVVPNPQAPGAINTSPAVVTQPISTPSQAPAVVEDQRGMRTGSPLDKRDKVDITARIKSVRDKDKQKMVFLLENDQIWLQETPRSLPFEQGDNIRIKSARLGGYMLSNERGVSTRVRRIK